MSKINSIKWSSVGYGHMEEHFFIKVGRRDGLQCRQTHHKLLEQYVDDALS
jgi:hypothetical protein